MEWVVSAIGAAVVVLLLLDVFHTLWHPGGEGFLSRRVMRAVWRASRLGARPDQVRTVGGPLALVAVILVWGLLAVAGWALVYLPHVPEGFRYGSSLEPAAREPLLDAIYLSVVVLATLGFGDIVPAEPWLRLVTPLQALVGFVLLTAAVSWILQVYPALSRRRALSLRASVVAEGSRATQAAHGPLPVPPAVIEALAADVAAVRVDLTQHLETYYFQETDCVTSLTHGLGDLLEVAGLAQHSPDAQTRWSGRVLRAAVEDLSRVVDRRFLHSEGSTEDVVAAYAAEHGHAHPPQEEDYGD